MLLPAAGDGLDAIDSGIVAARRAAGRPGRITLAVEFDLGEAWVDAIRAYAGAGRPFRVRVVRLHEAHVLEALREGGVDGAVHWTPPARSGLPGRILGRVPALIAMDGGHPLAARRTITLRDLAGHPFVMFDRDESPGLWEDYAGLLTAGRPHELAATDAVTVGASQGAMLDAVRGTRRLTFVTRDFWAAADARDLVAVPLRPALALPVYWSAPRGADAGPYEPLLAGLRDVSPAADPG
ncbi:MAG: LysR family transcriptional regulator substrate-binding protein [Thermoleophilia bacterium]|nr:LysR family transcriptional regulator substrate-binding protein [Thermoleophilia bacterium]